MKQSSKPMRPRQRVLDALAHNQPQRVPFSWNFGPTDEMKAVLISVTKQQSVDWTVFSKEVDDILQVTPRYVGEIPQAGRDIWGIERQAHSYGNGTYDEITFYPLSDVNEIRLIQSYPWPDPDAYDYAGFRDDIVQLDPDYMKAHKLAINTCGNPFEIYCWMTGLEQAMMNLVLHPDAVHAAMSCITQYFEERMRRSLANTADLVDILYFADDLGGQQTLLMSLKLYRKMVKPYHKRLFSLAHQLVPHAAVMYHSDGAVYDVIPDLLDAGINVLEAVQIDTAGMDPVRLKAAYGSELCFHGGISVQNLLPFSHPDVVARDCHRLVHTFGKKGGYIAAPTHAIQVGTPPENVFAMLRAVLGPEDLDAALDISQI